MGRILPYLYLIIFALTGFGCQPSSKSQNVKSLSTVKINIGDEPQTLDPRKARDLQSQTIARMLFEGLARVNPQEKAELALAKRVEVSSDLKTYTFHLKHSFWSNGDSVTATDFAYAWKKILSPDFPSDTAFHLYVIKNAKGVKEGRIPLEEIGVRAVDANTLVVELDCPTPYFLELTALPAFFPVNERVDREDPSWSQHAQTYVGNGPFVLVDWKHQDHLSLVKNPSYWDASAVHLSALELQMFNSDTELKIFEKEEIDWAGSPLSNLPIDAIKGLKSGMSLNTKEMLGTYFVRVNTVREQFADPAVRKAFALAIDRKAIIEHILQGNQLPATGLVPPSLGFHREPYFKDGDVEGAQALLSSFLASNGSLAEISLLYYAGERQHQMAQALQDQWFKAFGVRVKLEAAEGKIYFDRVSKQDYDLAMGSWIADFPDAINFLEVFKFKKGGSNNTLWENPRYIELLELSSRAADPQERIKLLAASEEILMEEMPILPVFYCTMLYLKQPRLQGVVLSSMGQLDFKWASIDGGNEAIAQGEKP